MKATIRQQTIDKIISCWIDSKFILVDPKHYKYLFSVHGNVGRFLVAGRSRKQTILDRQSYREIVEEAKLAGLDRKTLYRKLKQMGDVTSEDVAT